MEKVLLLINQVKFMKAIGIKTVHLGMEYISIAMDQNLKVIGVTTNKMDMVFIL